MKAMQYQKCPNRRHILRIFGSLLGGALLSLQTGCTFFLGPRSDMVPGIAFPEERVKTLHTLAEKAKQDGEMAQESLAAEMLAYFSKEKDPITRGEIVYEVGQFHTSSAHQLVQLAMLDSDAAVRRRGCRALAGWKNNVNAATLLCKTMLEDADHDVRLEAARSLATVAHPSSKQALAEALQDSDPAMQDLAVAALRRISPVDYGPNVARWKAHLQGEPVEEPSFLARQLESWNQ
ncbi:MAG: HEAT repeat domain-containing protein [Thermoguttaceae bacterium]|nr:HEAT repeat domain-containing protein [Thermoguttaceae bacterium]